MNGEGLFTLLGTILGFLLFVLWDRSKERQHQSKERKRIISLLRTELLSNLDACRNSKNILSHDLRSIEETKTESVISPLSFSDSSWHIVRAGDVMSIFDDEKLQKLSQLYDGFRMVNTVLANRDILRTTSKALVEYPLMMKAYNYRLIEMISTLEAEINEVLKHLETVDR